MAAARRREGISMNSGRSTPHDPVILKVGELKHAHSYNAQFLDNDIRQQKSFFFNTLLTGTIKGRPDDLPP